MQVEYRNITKNWVAFNAEGGVRYLIQNRGYDSLIALEADALPENTAEGVMVQPYKTIEYEKGDQTLYFRAFNQSCGINISTIEDNGGEGHKKKYGLSVDNLLGEVTSQGMLILPLVEGNVILNGVKSIGSQVLMWKFKDCNVKSFSAPDLESITTASACEGAFYNAGVSSISMPKLEIIGGYNSCRQMFRMCAAESVEINASTINGGHCCENMFERSLNLEELSFPNLTNVGDVTNQFHDMLLDCSNVTVHFKAEMESVIGEWNDVTNGFGGTNTTVLFDL